MKSARQAYASSQFERCATGLARAERDLARQLRAPGDLVLMKRLNEWIGLYLSAGGQAEDAAAAFARAARLPGPAPDPDVFRWHPGFAGGQ